MANVINETSQSGKVFINYYEKDSSSAQRLYLDLKAASLNPWIDKKNLLPGKNMRSETEKVIRECDYFIALFSTISVMARGNVQTQIRTALDVRKSIAGSPVFFIPARLDEVEIPFNELDEIQCVDLFSGWEEGLEKILSAMGVDDKRIKLVIQHQHDISPFSLPDDSRDVIQTQTFKGEKQFFVGRQNYINQIIKDKLIVPGSKVSIVGPGGSGKSQLAFKAIHKYLVEGIFDIVIPIYFDEGLIPFESFLSQIAEILGLKSDNFETNNTITRRKDIVRGLLSRKKHPLIYLDNFETVSMILNLKTDSDKTNELKLNAMQIIDFLDNVIPANNASLLVTSRERKNNLSSEQVIDLEGLSTEDSLKLFNAFMRPEFKDPKGKTKDQVEEILKRTGGHPLSIEIIAKNIRSIRELERLSNNLGGLLEEDSTQPEKRFQTLHACFDYTIDKLDTKLQELLPKLLLFSSPFPISAAIEIFSVTENEILDLYDRSLLTLIDSDEIYGKIQDPEYWLYSFHPIVRNYVNNVMKNKKEDTDLEIKYGDKFSRYYANLLASTINSMGKENHIPALARFNIISQGKDNDFEKTIKLAKNKQQSAFILTVLGLIIYNLGMLSKALQYFTRSMAIYEDTGDQDQLKEDYKSIGLVLSDMGNNQEALNYHKKALEIDTDLNDKDGMARDYTNIGNLLSTMGNDQEALDYHKKALEITISLSDRVGMARDYNNIGLALYHMGNNQEALNYLKKTLETQTDLKDRIGMAKAYTNIGLVLRDMGNYQEALNYHNKALEISTNLNDRVGMARDYNNIGLVLSRVGNNKEALEYLYKALEIVKELNDRVGMARVYSSIGITLSNIGINQEALDYYNKALNILRDLEKSTGSHHPLIETIQQRIEQLSNSDS